MIWLRVRKKFHSRASEWFSAWILFGWGTMVLHSSPTFEDSSYSVFGLLMGEMAAGSLFMLIGGLWVVALIINGRLDRGTAVMRMIAAGFGSVAFGTIALNFLLAYIESGYVWPGMWTYFMLSIMDAYNGYKIARDREAERNGCSTYPA